MDGVFVLDISNSIGSDANFNLMKDFVIRSIRLVHISAECSHAAVILFAANATIRFDLDDYTDEQSLINAINTIKWSDFDHIARTGTNTPAAVDLMRKAGQSGALGLRDGVLHIGVVITDGNPYLRHIDGSINDPQANQITENAGDRLHETEIYDQIYAIGINGSYGLGDTLKFIADPESLQYSIAGFDDDLFMQLGRDIAEEFCNREWNHL